MAAALSPTLRSLARRGSTAVLAKTHPSRPPTMIDRVLTKETLNPHLIRAQYAVRGELAIRAEELRVVRRRMLLAGALDKKTG